VNFFDDWGELSPDFDARDYATEDLITLLQERARYCDPVPVDMIEELLARGVDPSFIYNREGDYY